ncbi:hypothetical protein AB0950_07200 [Streptomyces sp. NPDC007189]|uniref:hypothetical protein n=1 Tax=Streptomyces sp. NPDC007189 TaxID=3154315 RepID=UPI0034530060
MVHAQGVVERAFLLDGGSLDALCNISKTLSDLPDLLRVERNCFFHGVLRVALLMRRVLVLLGLVDPLRSFSAATPE